MLIDKYGLLGYTHIWGDNKKCAHFLGLGLFLVIKDILLISKTPKKLLLHFCPAEITKALDYNGYRFGECCW